MNFHPSLEEVIIEVREKYYYKSSDKLNLTVAYIGVFVLAIALWRSLI